MNIISTGGAGYVGIHTAVELDKWGFEVIIIDDFSNSKEKQVKSLQSITKKDIIYYKVDMKAEEKLFEIFQKHKIIGVIHFAESVKYPLKYYKNNLLSSINLLNAMERFGVKTFLFSSSAAVYKPKNTPLVETDPTNPINPYGQTKLMTEQILKDIYFADPKFRIIILRYFNPIGTHASKAFGDFTDQENVLPVLKRCVNNGKTFEVFGGMNTLDKTGERDYVHVEDIAEGHVDALKYILKNDEGICETFNLGAGKSTSVLQLVKICEKIQNKPINYEIVGSRPGDASFVVADVSKAHKKIKWKAKRTIE